MRGHRPVAREFILARAQGRDGAGCVLWPFKLRQGYGVVTTPRPDRKCRPAHQLGNRQCVNLGHLKWGTRSENQLDRFRSHGDSNRGERNPRHKLTEGDVREIRASIHRTLHEVPWYIALIVGLLLAIATGADDRPSSRAKPTATRVIDNMGAWTAFGALLFLVIAYYWKGA